MAKRSKADATPCRWINGQQAFREFATHEGKTQSARHIKPLHWYIACRLVIEGGFRPDDITPRPPFRVEEKKTRKGRLRNILHYDPEKGGSGEQVILGGLKTKNVDVVVNKQPVGPVLAVSCKGVTKAFRNLTNRMKANDIAILEDGSVAEGIVCFHAALREMTARRGLRDEISRYEAMTMALIEPQVANAGSVLPIFPPKDCPLHLSDFFSTLYQRYEERFVYGAPLLADRGVTTRLEWDLESPVFARTVPEAKDWPPLDFDPRLAAPAVTSY